MAIIKFINSKTRLETLINYVTKKSKVFAVDGKDCLADSAVDEMVSVKKAFQKEGGRESIHIIQSFSPDDNITPEKVHELGMKLAEYFKNHQVLVATHIDKGHLHSHLVVNSVNFETGAKYQQSKQEMEQIKEYSRKLCLEAGLKVITHKAKVTDIKINEYKAIEKGNSWKKKLTQDIEDTMKLANNKYEFIRMMNEKGYKVTWRKERKYITYTTRDGKKCRDKKLHNEKYLKDNMNAYFEEKKMQKETKDIARKIVNTIAYNSKQNLNSRKANYKGDLSKQAQKEYALKKANASSISWEENEM